MIYIIDTARGFVAHETKDEAEAETYIRNAADSSGRPTSVYTIARGAKARRRILGY